MALVEVYIKEEPHSDSSDGYDEPLSKLVGQDDPTERMEISVDPIIFEENEVQTKKRIRKKTAAPITLEIDPAKLEKGPPYDCPHCEKQFFSVETFQKHLPVHSYRKNFSCDVCQKSFVVEKSLRIHKREHTGERPYPCSYCDKKFKESGSLTKHLLKHTGEKPYKCPLCDKSFARSMSLKIHERWHRGEKPYACELCDKRFTESKSLTRHGLSHSKETPYQCKYCEEKFKLKEEWSEHISRHSGGYMYECLACNEGFDALKLFRRHVALHGNEPPRCGLCQAVFTSVESMKTHLRRKTCLVRSEARFECGLCEARFVSRKRLANHRLYRHSDRQEDVGESSNHYITTDNINELHPLPTQRDIQNETLLTSAAELTIEVIGHVSAEDSVAMKDFEKIPFIGSKKPRRKNKKWTPNADNTYTCDVCNKIFPNSHCLTIHMRSHTGERPYTCNVCNKKFITSSKMNRHLRIHTGEKPFPCKVCYKYFSRSSYVKTHMKTHEREGVLAID